MPRADDGQVGVVSYRLGKKPGTLEAKWAHSANEGNQLCRGYAVGGPETGFEGRFAITYWDQADNRAGPFDLEITRDGEIYRLSWFHEGEQIDRGIGQKVGDLLVAGFVSL